jgi:hypothetical protein
LQPGRRIWPIFVRGDVILNFEKTKPVGRSGGLGLRLKGIEFMLRVTVKPADGSPVEVEGRKWE